MLESNAKTKFCPFKMNAAFSREAAVCSGPKCMGWDEWVTPALDETGKRQNPTSYVPHDPPQGSCGMKPPELNCSN